MTEHINFGIIGCGMMGREFSAASMRWACLQAQIPRPRILAVCNTTERKMEWFRSNPDIRSFCTDYHDLLNDPEIEAIYCAVPNHMHAQIYCDIIRSGKHLLGEKPFGIDMDAYQDIEACMAAHPEVFVRCSSEFPYYPGAQQMIRWYREGRFGQIIEARFTVKHSSDMDRTKPINWKRTLRCNGRYGCMGDLGIHAQHLPFRLGFRAKTVSAQLADLIRERPDGKGGIAACETYDNAILLCEAQDAAGDRFPMTFELKRMAPGCSNTVEYEIYGMDRSAKFSTEDANAVWFLDNTGRDQAWCRLPVGCKPMFPVITGSIFEFGFGDALLQMYAAFIAELRGLDCPFGCMRPDEVRMSHEMLTAALDSYENRRILAL